jgi:hypothetical protein
MLMLPLAEIVWRWAAARIACAADTSKPDKRPEDKAAIDADRELTISLLLSVGRTKR